MQIRKFAQSCRLGNQFKFVIEPHANTNPSKNFTGKHISSFHIKATRKSIYLIRFHLLKSVNRGTVSPEEIAVVDLLDLSEAIFICCSCWQLTALRSTGVQSYNVSTTCRPNLLKARHCESWPSCRCQQLCPVYLHHERPALVNRALTAWPRWPHHTELSMAWEWLASHRAWWAHCGSVRTMMSMICPGPSAGDVTSCLAAKTYIVSWLSGRWPLDGLGSCRPASTLCAVLC